MSGTAQGSLARHLEADQLGQRQRRIGRYIEGSITGEGNDAETAASERQSAVRHPAVAQLPLLASKHRERTACLKEAAASERPEGDKR